MANLGGALNIGSSLLSGFMGSRSAERAADTQAAAGERAAQLQLQAQQEAIAEQRRQFDLARGDLMPWQQAGTAAVNRLQYLLGLGGTAPGVGAPGVSYAPPDISSQQAALAQAEANLNNLLARGGAGGGTGTLYAPPEGSIAGLTGDQLRMAYSLGYDPQDRTRTENQAVLDTIRRMTAGTTAAGPGGGGYSQAELQAAQDAVNQARNALRTAQTSPGTAMYSAGAGDPSDPLYGSLMRDFRDTNWTTEDPGYEFRRQEGQRAVESSGSARGMTLSGAQLKGLQRYGQGLASQEYQNAYNRYAADQTRKYNQLAGVAGTGQIAAQQVGGLGSSMAGNIGNVLTGTAANVGNLYTGIGNVRAAGQVGASNAWGNALGGVSDYWQTQNLLNRLSSNPFSSGGSSRSLGWEDPYGFGIG